MCRKHEHLPRTNRRAADNVDKFWVIVADLSQKPSFSFVSVLSVTRPD